MNIKNRMQMQNNKIIKSKETVRFFDSSAVTENICCCLCCCIKTGGRHLCCE